MYTYRYIQIHAIHTHTYTYKQRSTWEKCIVEQCRGPGPKHFGHFFRLKNETCKLVWNTFNLIQTHTCSYKQFMHIHKHTILDECVAWYTGIQYWMCGKYTYHTCKYIPHSVRKTFSEKNGFLNFFVCICLYFVCMSD